MSAATVVQVLLVAFLTSNFDRYPEKQGRSQKFVFLCFFWGGIKVFLGGGYKTVE